ncbi:MAG TPA: oligopeptide/dipeptide ABC transporter ATP-binding protein [Candidatus Polarisedimenticolia bacterium]|nr:oligopeptide/dipeptide ABC transporter ATP-binding protein [Candidatus Polarisedimenticolia bacterium]
MSAPLLEVTGLEKRFPIRRGLFGRVRGEVRAVDGVSFDVRPGETLALVGESGSGKTTTGRLVLRLLDPSAGAIRFDGADLLALSPRELRRRRRDLQVIFQDPYGSLNPRMRVGTIVREPLDIHKVGANRAERDRMVDHLLERVGLDPGMRQRYPHEFSGGQRQRIGVARAIALRPKLIVADEPVSALDVSVQAQVINLLVDLQEEYGCAYLFIAHDLALVERIADRVAVMYLGRIVESGPAADLFRNPLHPYTRALLQAIPVPDPERVRERAVLGGDPPSPAEPPPGCRFHPRCPVAVDLCRREDPALREAAPGHRAACHLAPGS